MISCLSFLSAKITGMQALLQLSEISVHLRRGRKTRALCYVKTHREGMTRRKFSPGSEYVVTFTFNFPGCRTERNMYMLLKSLRL
jgi:hypothetical protein